MTYFLSSNQRRSLQFVFENIWEMTYIIAQTNQSIIVLHPFVRVLMSRKKRSDFEDVRNRFSRGTDILIAQHCGKRLISLRKILKFV